MDQVVGSISHIVVESALESALLWVLVLAYLRWFGVKDPAVRAVAFLLPLLVPVALTTTFHVLLPQRPSGMPHFKLFEPYIGGYVPQSLHLWLLLLLSGMAGVAASLVLVWRQWRTWTQARRIWHSQQNQRDTRLRHRCHAMMSTLAARLGRSAPRLVLASSGGPRSLALWGHGYIFIPWAMVARLGNEELEALLAHEMGHIVRKDSLLGCLAKVCRNLMLFNPLAHLALSRFEKEQEESADDIAMRIGGNRLALASCLLKVYRSGGHQAGLPMTALVASHSALERRVRRIVGGAEARASSGVAWLALALLAGVAIVAFALML